MTRCQQPKLRTEIKRNYGTKFSFGEIKSSLFSANLSGPRVVSRLVCETLRCGECRCAGRVGEEGIMAIKLVADSEVGDLHQPVWGRPEQVAWLDVAVDYLLVVDWYMQQKKVGNLTKKGWFLHSTTKFNSTKCSVAFV